MSGPTGDAAAGDAAAGDAAAEGVPGPGRRAVVDPAELALIAAAADQVWPRPAEPVPEEVGRRTAWRFSGRWWVRPPASRRSRPRLG